MNVKNSKNMINSQKARKFREERKFNCAVCGKAVDSNFISCQLYKCGVNKRCSDVKGRLKDDDKFKLVSGIFYQIFIYRQMIAL